MPRIAIVDPLTLVGRATADMIAALFPEADLEFFHTSTEEDHQIAQVAGTAALVPPVKSAQDLADRDIVILASDVASARMKPIEEAIDGAESSWILIDAGSAGAFRHRTVPRWDHEGTRVGGLFRPVDPAIAVTASIVGPMADLGLQRIGLGVVEPASLFGKSAVETLMHQAAQRLQGEPVTELIDGEIMAFNLTARSAGSLTDEAGLMLPGLDVAATRLSGSCFHGHFLTLSLHFEAEVEPEAVAERLAQAGGATLTPFPLRLDTLVDREGLWVTTPEPSSGGRSVTVQASFDGVAITAVTVGNMVRGH